MSYISNSADDTVSVIDTGGHTRVDTDPLNVGVQDIPFDFSPFGVAVHPDGTRVYVTNHEVDFVSVIGVDHTTDPPTYTVKLPPIPVGPHAAAESYMQECPEPPAHWRIDLVSVRLDLQGRVETIGHLESAVEIES